MPLRDALDRFTIQLRADGRSPHTVAQYARHVRVLHAWLRGERRSDAVADIDHEALALFLVSPAATHRPDGEPKKARSLNALRSSLRGFFGYLFAAGMVPRDPARLIRRARCGPPVPRALSPAAVDRLMLTLDAAEGEAARRDRVLFGLMLSTGLRLGEALALRWADVDLDAGELLVRSGKGDRERLVPLSEPVCRQLVAYRDQGRAAFLFPGSTGGALTPRQARRRLSLWLRRAGIERAASPHALRHTFATRLYEQSRDLFVVQRALGHANIGSTMVYAVSG